MRRLSKYRSSVATRGEINNRNNRITELKTDLPKKNATDYRITQKTENSVLIPEYAEVNRCGFLVNRQNNRINFSTILNQYILFCAVLLQNK